ncbi:MAG: glycosyltransferase [Thermoanaerobaculia bacterium]
MLRVLWIATKAPWPTRDGGRLLLAESLRALASFETGSAPRAEITLVAPVARRDLAVTEEALRGLCRPRLVATRLRSRGVAALAAAVTGKPYSVARHDRPELRRAVARELAGAGSEPFDLVVAEQLQAFAASRPAVHAGVPRWLRAQNVESDLWRQLGEASRGVARALLLREASRLAAAERAAIGSAAATLALSAADAGRLRFLGPESAFVEVLAPPFPGELSGAAQQLPGNPALVLFGSAGWEPNRRGERRFVDEIWPRVRAASPGALLHWFGGDSSGQERPGVLVHGAPATSAEAFSPGAILVLPLDIASGVRMRVLEGWARGVAIVASPAAASGLNASDGQELLLAESAEQFAFAIERLATLPGLREHLIAGGRARLASDHAAALFAARFATLAERLAGRAAGASGG